MTPTAAPTETPMRSRSAASTLVLIIAAIAVLADGVQVFVMTTAYPLFTATGLNGTIPVTYLPQIAEARLREGTTPGLLGDVAVWLRVLSATPTMIHGLTIVVAAGLVTRIMNRIARRQPFEPSVLRGWQRLAAVIIGGGLLQGVLNTVSWWVIFGPTNAPRPNHELPLGADYQLIIGAFPYWPVFFILTGVIAAAIGAAFTAGARLEREVEGVV